VTALQDKIPAVCHCPHGEWGGKEKNLKEKGSVQKKKETGVLTASPRRAKLHGGKKGEKKRGYGIKGGTKRKKTHNEGEDNTQSWWGNEANSIKIVRDRGEVCASTKERWEIMFVPEGGGKRPIFEKKLMKGFKHTKLYLNRDIFLYVQREAQEEAGACRVGKPVSGSQKRSPASNAQGL